jgi:hypothetical protein
MLGLGFGKLSHGLEGDGTQPEHLFGDLLHLLFLIKMILNEIFKLIISLIHFIKIDIIKCVNALLDENIL